jgi:integrase
MALGNARLTAIVNELIAAFRRKGREFKSILKMGRTQLRDAVPMTLGQEFSTYAVMLGEDEEHRLIEACSGPRAHLRPLVIAALDTTLRRGSLFRLTWSDVNFDEKIIKVKKSSTKTETAVTVGITRRLETELRDLYEHSDRRPETLVFGLGDIKRGWRSACRVAEIEGLRFHDLRAGGATSMVQAGIPVAIVRKVTGHADPAVLLDHYIRADVVAARQIAEALDRARADREPPVPTSPLIN